MLLIQLHFYFTLHMNFKCKFFYLYKGPDFGISCHLLAVACILQVRFNFQINQVNLSQPLTVNSKDCFCIVKAITCDLWPVTCDLCFLPAPNWSRLKQVDLRSLKQIDLDWDKYWSGLEMNWLKEYNDLQHIQKACCFLYLSLKEKKGGM